MKNHFVIVAGYLDTDEKTKIAIDLIEKLRKVENISIWEINGNKHKKIKEIQLNVKS